MMASSAIGGPKAQRLRRLRRPRGEPMRAHRLPPAPRRRRAGARPAARRMVRARAGARGRHQPRQPRARPDRAGDVCCSARPATRDRLAFHRDVLDFRNCLLVEQPNGDFAQTIARHLLYSTWQHMLLQRLTQSSDQFLREFAAKAVKEVAYHRELATEWTIRLGDGTEESARRMAEGLDWCWRFVPELFEVDESAAGGDRRRHRARPARVRGGISLGDRGGAGRSAARTARRSAPDPRRPARPPQRASRPSARRDAVPAAHLPRRDLVDERHGRAFPRAAGRGGRSRDRRGQFDPLRDPARAARRSSRSRPASI